jgi:hypothetical protein
MSMPSVELSALFGSNQDHVCVRTRKDRMLRTICLVIVYSYKYI